jgi:hypothetical protein
VQLICPGGADELAGVRRPVRHDGGRLPPGRALLGGTAQPLATRLVRNTRDRGCQNGLPRSRCGWTQQMCTARRSQSITRAVIAFEPHSFNDALDVCAVLNAAPGQSHQFRHDREARSIAIRPPSGQATLPSGSAGDPGRRKRPGLWYKGCNFAPHFPRGTHSLDATDGRPHTPGIPFRLGKLCREPG